jgi:hypothetical protein
MENELEDIFKQIATDLHNKPGKNELIELTGWDNGDESVEKAVEIREEGNNKTVKFNGQYRENPRSFPILQRLINHLDENHYRWI